MIDFHVHTTASDGQYTPAEIVTLAEHKKITHLAITDHDTIAGIEEALMAVQNTSIHFYSGIEFSAAGNKELHILGYHFDIQNTRLKMLCNDMALERESRKYRIIDFLANHGVHISLEDVQTYAKISALGRPHFAQAMLAKGYVSSIREAFDKYLATPAFDKIERKKPSAEEIINTIHQAGGIAVLAHPLLLKLERNDFEALLEKLKILGLDGLECYYSLHSKKDVHYYLEQAVRYNLKVSAGSDFHGEKVKPDIILGVDINIDRISII